MADWVLCLRISHNVALKVPSQAEVISRLDQSWNRFQAQPQSRAVGRPQMTHFQVHPRGFWQDSYPHQLLEGDIFYSPHGLPHNRTARFSQGESPQARRSEGWPARWKLEFFCNLMLGVTSHYFSSSFRVTRTGLRSMGDSYTKV